MPLQLTLTPVLLIDAVDENVEFQDAGSSLHALSQTFRYGNRAVVLWRDEADDMRHLQMSESPVHRRARRFGGIPLAPEFATQRPADFKCRPGFRIVTADAPHEFARRLLHDGPHAVTAKKPVPANSGHTA